MYNLYRFRLNLNDLSISKTQTLNVYNKDIYKYWVPEWKVKAVGNILWTKGKILNMKA